MRSVEQQIIEQIRRASRSVASRGVRIGIGDDTAVLRAPRAGLEILLTTDQVIENTHFTRENHPARALGHKTLARGLSDIAAMGGEPLSFLLSLCLPEWGRDLWLKQYIYGMFQLAKTDHVPCVGGDVARGERFCAEVTVVGTAARGRVLRRDGARPGDLLFVSGRLGGSALGLSRLLSGESGKSAAARRHLFPQPRLALGRLLASRLRASAAMDLSDGLSMDLGRLARSSGVGAEVDGAAVPIFPGATLEQALHGGEEYELLFTVRPGTPVPGAVDGVRLSCIGRIRKGRGMVLRTERGVERLEPCGFQHFPRAREKDEDKAKSKSQSAKGKSAKGKAQKVKGKRANG
jgi:thiamine-monophosphate kinase